MDHSRDRFLIDLTISLTALDEAPELVTEKSGLYDFHKIG